MQGGTTRGGKRYRRQGAGDTGTGKSCGSTEGGHSGQGQLADRSPAKNTR